ncbi:unnamed protein product [Prorocentrum cordatum]|uniref:Uncharacterized protein n=1 Tax=Prorocentrum cordatum TaxID=2364126 RepID=A0ABN9QMR7_9DINO|nr:unnamed protein product [Polarella glacialis]
MRRALSLAARARPWARAGRFRRRRGRGRASGDLGGLLAQWRGDARGRGVSPRGRTALPESAESGRALHRLKFEAVHAALWRPAPPGVFPAPEFPAPPAEARLGTLAGAATLEVELHDRETVRRRAAGLRARLREIERLRARGAAALDAQQREKVAQEAEARAALERLEDSTRQKCWTSPGVCCSRFAPLGAPTSWNGGEWRQLSGARPHVLPRARARLAAGHAAGGAPGAAAAAGARRGRRARRRCGARRSDGRRAQAPRPKAQGSGPPG